MKPFNENKQMFVPIYAGAMGFNDKNHVFNFVRYLFGAKSGRHKINFLTKNNVFSEDGEHYDFTKRPFDLYNTFTFKHAAHLKDYKNIENDVFYTPFIFIVKKTIISNFLELGEDNDLVNIVLDDAAIDHMVRGLGLGDESDLESLINELIVECDTIVPYRKCEGKLRLDIEEYIHRSCNEVMPRDTLITISHDDQIEDHPFYHLHRLYKKPKPEDNITSLL